MLDGDCLRYIYASRTQMSPSYIYASIIIGIVAVFLQIIGMLTVILYNVIINVLNNSALVDGDLSYN